MVSGLIPNRYAKALYKFALEHGKAEEVYGEMQNVISSFEANADLEKVMSNPNIDNKDKENLLIKAAGEHPGDAYNRFVKLILDHKREAFAYLMALAYRNIYREANNISQVKIQTAAQLPATEETKLKDLVIKSFPGRTLEFTTVVNPDLIGGFVIDVDSTRLDASLSNELEQLRQNLIRSN